MGRTEERLEAVHIAEPETRTAILSTMVTKRRSTTGTTVIALYHASSRKTIRGPYVVGGDNPSARLVERSPLIISFPLNQVRERIEPGHSLGAKAMQVGAALNETTNSPDRLVSLKP